ncbi:MAG: SDR family oxidoreductase [Candidatus Nanopelagicales bacterium]
MDSQRHVGRTALVTGAGSGIGRATVLELLAEGAVVIGVDLSDTGFADLRHEAGAAADRLEIRQVDVTSAGEVGALVADHERIDVLVNNAGVMDHFLPVGEVDDATWDAVLAVNLTSVMRLTRAVLPVMEGNGGGAIVTVASKGALSAGASGVAYAASKHGVIGVVKHTAWFYGPRGIRSNAVCPGAVATGIGASAMPRSEWVMARAQLAMASMGEIAEPASIASVISWLASDEAGNVNGAVVTADGGWDAA